MTPTNFLSEVRRRRTFAIISHPDAGKTTLTEKLLLYTGKIQEAGEVKAKAHRRKTVSDWMELEKQRGISISSSVLQFDFENLRINLLDTPGHKDFSEDTYRTLMAADTAVMVIDAAKGVETQTKKLFEVCRMRNIPILTFVNKMDREARDPFELMKELEDVLKITANPVTWPIGMGDRFKGVYHRLKKEFHFFEPSEKVGDRAQLKVLSCEIGDKALLQYVDEEQQLKLIEDMELLDGALGPVEKSSFLSGVLTPTLFGSARNNFGISSFLQIFHDFTPAPQPKEAKPKEVKPEDPDFSAFVFKIQANMDKNHRDRMAFMRICSGRFERDMDVKIARNQKPVRLSHSKQFMAQERATVDEAYAGDIIGVHDSGNFKIGDTVYCGKPIEFLGIPQFSPECFGRLTLRDPMKRKQLQKGISELCEEGLVQMFIDPRVGEQDPILGVVGVLQFDVMMFRLQDEYRVEARLERLPYEIARWVKSQDESIKLESQDLRVPLLRDQHNQWVVLCKSEWELQFLKKNLPPSLQWFSNSFEALKI